MGRLTGLTLVALLLATSHAAAQDHDAQARALFAEGDAAYSAGRFEEALNDFRQAHELSGRPQLLYNCGMASMNLGHDREALDYFQHYLEAVPTADNRGLVEARISALRSSISRDEQRQHELEAASRGREEAAARAEREARARRESEARSSEGPKTAGLVLTIGGGVVAAAGVVLFIVGMVDYGTVQSAAEGTAWTTLSGANDRAPLLTGIGIAAGVLGLTGVGVGIALLASSGGSATERATARLELTPNGVLLRGTF